MKYLTAEFFLTASVGCDEVLSEAVADVVAAAAGEAGFEAFERVTPDEPGDAFLRGYVQTACFDDATLDALLQTLPFGDGVHVSYTVREAPDCDWNAAWEEEGFDPIVVGHSCVVHDGRHRGDLDLADFAMAIEIDARLAFGTGSHQTTRLMLQALMAVPLAGRRVVDCGTGTGILAICALKCGAAHAAAYDIDEWSVDNARHNAVLNGVADRIGVVLGDAGWLDAQTERYDVLMANINRNILLADMPVFAAHLVPGGTMLLSGFLTDDVPLMEQGLAAQGLRVLSVQSEDAWACIVAGPPAP